MSIIGDEEEKSVVLILIFLKLPSSVTNFVGSVVSFNAIFILEIVSSPSMSETIQLKVIAGNEVSGKTVKGSHLIVGAEFLIGISIDAG